jgi:hypothetical protein
MTSITCQVEWDGGTDPPGLVTRQGMEMGYPGMDMSHQAYKPGGPGMPQVGPLFGMHPLSKGYLFRHHCIRWSMIVPNACFVRLPDDA